LTTTLGRANFTAAYLALLLPLIFTAAQLAAHRWQRLGYGALLLVTGSVILLTQARAGWIAAVVGVGLLVWLQFVPRWSLRVRWLTALAGLSGLLGGLLLVLQRGIASGGSIAARWTIWQASLRLLWPRLWLGYGADSLELYFPSVYPPQLVYYQGRGVVVDRAHNWLLDWSLNYGVVATLIFIVFLLLILRMGWQQITQKDSEVANFEERRWLAASLAAICAHLVGNLFLFEVAATAVLFWLLLAVVVASTTTLSVPHSVPVAGPRWRHAAVLSGVILVWGIAVWQGNVRPLLADRHSWLGTQALNQGEAGRALAEYETAVAIQPKRVPYLVALALIAAQVGNFEQAEEGINEAIVLRPIDPVLYTYLAAIAAREAIQTESPEKGDQAYAAYERAIDLAPTIGLTNQQFADFALRWGDSETAVLQAQQAVTLDATDGIAFGILGWAQLQLGNLAAAQHAFEQAVKWQPDSADFHLGLATAAYEQRDLMLARQAVQRSLSIDASYAPAIALQIELQEK
jgi:Tfp pilus assembly protein PilF